MRSPEPPETVLADRPARRFGVAHSDAAELAERVARQIRERYPDTDVMIVECGPALGAHGGPGAVAVAVLP